MQVAPDDCTGCGICVAVCPVRSKTDPTHKAIDLEPAAWHWTWEHNGAPQVNARFGKIANGRKMESADWAAWIAVKMIVQSAMRTR